MGKVTNYLIILNTLIFILVFSFPKEVQTWVFETLSFSGPASIEVWRWITSLFLHVSASHLFFNMLGLYFFGKILEKDVKREWFISIYFVSGLLGNFIFMLTNPNFVVGASGAVFGIMGAAMLLNPVKKIHMYVIPLPLGIIAIMFVIFESLVIYFQPKEFANVANISHIGGILTGSVFALFFDAKRALKGALALGVCVVLLIILAPVFAIITGIGGFILNIIESLVGFFLYGAAKMLSFIWI